MYKKIFVISDLHLGGKTGFQMCSGKEKLAEFINWVTNEKESDQKKSEIQTEYNLVLAGDIIDFLAEEKWESFTSDENVALEKLEKVFENFKIVWNALQNYVASGAILTILLGKHDLEMSLPKLRRRLFERLGNGKIEFIYDNEALVIGDVIIEHGNRYDPWNAINHDALRQIRSALSREETIKSSLKVPGSLMVNKVMNPIKKIYPFIDLLKPEDAAVALLISILEPSQYAIIKNAVKPFLLQKRVKYDESMTPTNYELISGRNEDSINLENFNNFEWELRNIVRFDDSNTAANIAGGLSFRDVLDKLPGFGHIIKSRFSNSDEERLDQLYKGFRSLIKKQKIENNPKFDDYEKAAENLAKKFKVIVFGHTHKAKRIEFANGSQYFNSGTWADVILFPKSLSTDNEEVGKKDLKEFITDLTNSDEQELEEFTSNSNYSKWIIQKGTFVEINLNQQNELIDSGVFHFISNEKPQEPI